jgi:enoyl-CoA hydratase
VAAATFAPFYTGVAALSSLFTSGQTLNTPRVPAAERRFARSCSLIFAEPRQERERGKCTILGHQPRNRASKETGQMEYQQIRIRIANRVALCGIYNPPMNLMTGRMTEELEALIEELAADDSVRVVVFTGGVEGVFITHFDVSELVALSGMEAPVELPKAAEMPHHRMQRRLQDLPKPVIAAINGQCGGGGCEFALACDLRIMAIGDFGIGLPEVGVGILPGGGGTQRLPRLIGYAKALEMMLLGKVIGAEEAERIGLVHKAVPAVDFMPTVLALAQRLAAGAPIAQGLIKHCVYEGRDLPLDDALQIELEAFIQTLGTEDAREAMKAYLQGGLYEFKGR